MTDKCPLSEIEQLRAENERLKQVAAQYAELVNSVAEARDKTNGQAERELDPGMSAVFAAMNLAYETVLAKAEALAYPPDSAVKPHAQQPTPQDETTAGGSYAAFEDPAVKPAPLEDREGP